MQPLFFWALSCLTLDDNFGPNNCLTNQHHHLHANIPQQIPNVQWLVTDVPFTVFTIHITPLQVNITCVCYITRHLKSQAAPSSVSVPWWSVPGLVSATLSPMTPGLTSTLVHTLTPWHVPLFTNPPLTPLCSITLDNRTLTTSTVLTPGQPALAASDGTFPFPPCRRPY